MNAIKRILFFVFLTFSLCGLCIIVSEIECQYLKIHPKAPVYPNSVLVEEKFFGPSAYPELYLTYLTPDSPEEIKAFYQEVETCFLSDGERWLCGYAKPFGEYTVRIDYSSDSTNGKTSYEVEIRWRACYDDRWSGEIY